MVRASDPLSKNPKNRNLLHLSHTCDVFCEDHLRYYGPAVHEKILFSFFFTVKWINNFTFISESYKALFWMKDVDPCEERIMYKNIYEKQVSLETDQNLSFKHNVKLKCKIKNSVELKYFKIKKIYPVINPRAQW